MKTLVTGAGGFLGLYIVEQLLAAGHEVRATVRRPARALERLGAECVRADLCDREAVFAACAGRDCVFHVAAMAGVWGPWRRYHAVNTEGTRHVVEACRRQGVGRLIYTSSPSVVFAGEDQCGVDESAPYPRRWLCPYPRSKALAEQIVLENHGRDGLATCALRPHLIWGPRDPNLVPRIVRRARHGQLRRVGDGRNLIDTTYVENAAEAHLLAADALSRNGQAGGKAYFISQGEPVGCWQWIGRLLEAAGAPSVIRAMSFATAWRWGALCENAYRLLPLRGEPPMTRFLAAQLARSHYYQIGRAAQDLGYRPRVGTEEGLRRLAVWLNDGRAAMS